MEPKFDMVYYEPQALDYPGVLQPNYYMLVITPINRAIFLSTKLDFGVAISKYLWYNSK